MWGYDDERDPKRTLGERDKKILYRNAGGRCENPACRKKIDYDEMLAGHKIAWSKRGKTNLANSVCLCYRCNNNQGKDSWAVFLKKQGVEDPKIKVKGALNALTITQLKFLAKKHNIIVKGQIEESLFDSHRIAPIKSQYINRLSGIVTEKEIKALPKTTPKKAKRRRKSESDDSWW